MDSSASAPFFLVWGVSALSHCVCKERGALDGIDILLAFHITCTPLCPVFTESIPSVGAVVSLAPFSIFVHLPPSSSHASCKYPYPLLFDVFVSWHRQHLCSSALCFLWVRDHSKRGGIIGACILFCFERAYSSLVSWLRLLPGTLKI